ncbi:KH domain [Musa troglodytarum]|uniref:KH domain n=1 Tax=Musa troglodytarum TaxID=320322 RepID=A0A9E7KR67_9LILI|nr:KH domain [Musa troglodytarum]
MLCSGGIVKPPPLVPRHPSWRFAPTCKIERQQPPAILRWTPRASGDADAVVPSSSSVDTAGPGDSAEKNPAGFCIIEGPETVQDFAKMELQEIQDNIKSRRNKIFLHMEEVRRLRIQQRIKNAELGIFNEKQENELPDFPSFIPFLPPLTPANLKVYYATCFTLIGGIIIFGGLLAPTLELKLGLGGTSYADFIRSMRLPMQLSQVDPIVASFSGGAVGVISALMVVEINNVQQQEHKRCRYCLGTGYLACARCSSTGALVLIQPVATVNDDDQPLSPPRTERCSNCSGYVSDMPLHWDGYGHIIGRKGELIKKLCEETKARVRILEGPIGVSDRIVLISGKEEPEAEISPAMDAVLRIFKRVNGFSDSSSNSGSAPVTCSVRLLVASSQAVNLIGKKGEAIRSIQESSNATVRVLSGELPFYAAPDERIVEIQGESLKVLKALEAVIGHLRKFLVDHSVLPLFEKSYNTPVTQDRPVDTWGENTQSYSHGVQQSAIGNDYGLPLKRDSFFLDRESQLDSQIPRSGLALYGQDPAVSGLRSSALGRTGSALEVTQKMQIPLTYAEDIIGIGGGNIAYIRRTSGAVITVQETRGLADEITVEMKGTTAQVHVARQLVQEFITGRREPVSSNYGGVDTGLRSSYSQLASTAYPSSSYASHSYGGYGSSGLGGYGGYRL